jgi:hypothetical protein
LPVRGPIKHGTDGGYRLHKQRGLTPCEDCRRAHSETLAVWRGVLATCRDCGEYKRRAALGRCGQCYSRMRRAKGKKL